MLTISHIAHHLSTAPHLPEAILDSAPVVYCIYCGVEIADVHGTPRQPLTCPLKLQNLSGQEWNACADCANIAASIWYYVGAGRTVFPHPKLKGAALDIYVWILRENPQDDWTRVPVPIAARELRYSRGAIAAALARLCARGILEKRPRMGRYREYRPLIWQRPKGE